MPNVQNFLKTIPLIISPHSPHHHPLRSDLIPYSFTAACIPPTPVPPTPSPKRRRPSSSSPSRHAILPSSDSAASAAVAERAGEDDEEDDDDARTGGYACNWNIYAPSAVAGAGVDQANFDSNLRGIYNSGDCANAADVVNNGGDIVINFEVFHCSQGKLMLALACLGSNSLADLIDFLHPTFIIGKQQYPPSVPQLMPSPGLQAPHLTAISCCEGVQPLTLQPKPTYRIQ